MRATAASLVDGSLTTLHFDRSGRSHHITVLGEERRGGGGEEELI